jgi:predicted nucleic acid-binding protein
MDFLVDSDIVIDHLNDDQATVGLLSRLTITGVSISIVTYMEVYEGIIRSPDPVAAQAKVDDFLDGIPVVPFAEDVARRCARMREDLRQQGRRVRPRALDLITAATAL